MALLLLFFALILLLLNLHFVLLLLNLFLVLLLLNVLFVLFLVLLLNLLLVLLLVFLLIFLLVFLLVYLLFFFFLQISDIGNLFPGIREIILFLSILILRQVEVLELLIMGFQVSSQNGEVNSRSVLASFQQHGGIIDLSDYPHVR